MASQVITCKAAVCWALGEPFRIEEIEVEAPRSMEVRIKMLCSSLCHTDVTCWKEVFEAAYAPFPRVLGHEGVGVVESIGEGVTEVNVGDHVIPTYIGECKHCPNCTSEKSNICYKYPPQLHGVMLDNTTRMSVKGEILHHAFSCSTWSEYTVVNVNYVLKVSSELSLQHASILSCGFTTGYGAAWREAKVAKGTSVVVFGLGGVGLGVIQGARMSEASKIIGVDINEGKREIGEMFGMTDFINPKDSEKSVTEIVKEMTDGLGVDCGFECTGVPSLINTCLEATKPGSGTVIIIGASNEMNARINVLELFYGKTLKGSVFGGIKPQSDLPCIVEKCLNKEIELDSLVTHEVELEDINKAFEIAKQPDCLKIIIPMNKKSSTGTRARTIV